MTKLEQSVLDHIIRQSKFPNAYNADDLKNDDYLRGYGAAAARIAEKLHFLKTETPKNIRKFLLNQ